MLCFTYLCLYLIKQNIMKKYLFMIALLASMFSFSACSDDDDEIDVKQLEGTWGLIRDEGYEYDEDGKDSWNDPYDPANPSDDSEKLIISKISDNTYSVVHYEYYNGTWHSYATEKFTLNGNKLIPVDGDSEGFNVKLLSANSKLLVIEIKGKDEYGDMYNKMTYKRM